MITKIMKWVFLVALLLVLLWPSPADYPIPLRLGFAVFAGALLAAQASRVGKYSWDARCMMVSRKVKYEN
jgi:hypothetical protein